MGVPTYQWRPDEIRVHEHIIERPLHCRRPRMVFTNSMSDFFHEAIPFETIDRVVQVMRRTPWQTYQVLTKRSRRMLDYSERTKGFPENVWCGVSVESAAYKFRIEHLRRVQAKVRFLSVEPLIEPIGSLDLAGIHWVIVGGESGRDFRPLSLDWVRDIRDQCLQDGVAFFFKQVGGLRAKSGGRLLDGREWNEYPTDCTSEEGVVRAGTCAQILARVA